MTRYMRTAALAALAMIAAILCNSCEEKTVGSDAVDLQRVTIVVLDSGTSTPLPGAEIIIDNDGDLSCATPDPSGECRFALKRIRHSISISKPTYVTLNTTFDVMSTTTIKYFTIYRAPLKQRTDNHLPPPTRTTGWPGWRVSRAVEWSQGVRILFHFGQIE